MVATGKRGGIVKSVMPASSEVERFRVAVATQLGLAFDEDKLAWLSGVLESKLLETRLSPDAFLGRLEAGGAPGGLPALAETLTIGETFFFRNVDQHRALLETVLPDLIGRRASQRRLSLLSAGCSSGEEAYSLAILLKEVGVDPSWDVSIRAVDVNPAALARAAGAQYSEWSFRGMSPERKERWFRQEGREAIPHDSIRSAVHFEQKNLVVEDEEFWRRAAYDLVLCRNVIMYFTRAQAAGVLDHVARSLAPGGYLFLGHAESLHGPSEAFELCHSHNTFYYQRTSATLPQRLPVSDGHQVSEQPQQHAPAGKWADVIGDAAARIRDLAAPAAAPEVALEAACCAAPAWNLAPVLGLLAEEKFSEARAMVDALPPESEFDRDVLLLRAVILLHAGETAASEETCAKLLEVDEMSVGARYVLAQCREARGDLASAREHDRIAIRIDPNFSLPRLHYGLLARRAGDVATASEELSKALPLLAAEDPSRILLFAGGFSRDVLVNLCRSELRRTGRR